MTLLTRTAPENGLPGTLRAGFDRPCDFIHFDLKGNLMDNQTAIAAQQDQNMENPRQTTGRQAWLQEGLMAWEDCKTAWLHLEN